MASSNSSLGRRASTSFSSARSAAAVARPPGYACRRAPGSRSRVVGALVRAAALLAGEAGGGDQPRDRERVARRARAAPSALAAQAGVAPERVAASPAGGPARRVGRGRRARPRPAARDRASPRARRGARTRSTRRASSRRAGWRRAGRCRRTRRPRRGPGRRRAPVEVGGHAAHRVVGGRGDRHRVARRGRCPTSASAAARCSGSGRGRPRAGRARRRAGRCARSSASIASATSSRGASSSTKRSPCGVEQRRALAAHGLGDQEAVARAVGHAARWGGTA